MARVTSRAWQGLSSRRCPLGFFQAKSCCRPELLLPPRCPPHQWPSKKLDTILLFCFGITKLLMPSQVTPVHPNPSQGGFGPCLLSCAPGQFPSPGEGRPQRAGPHPSFRTSCCQRRWTGQLPPTSTLQPNSHPHALPQGIRAPRLMSREV